MNRQLVGMLAAVAGVSIGALVYADDNQSSNQRFSFAVIGDQPYSPVTGGTPNRQIYPAPAYERLIADINRDNKVDFTVHIGDIKEGNSVCEDAVYTQNQTYFNTFRQALIYTPGDNEWTDCHRASNGSMDPLNRLALVRSTFFPNAQSLGNRKRTLVKPAGAHAAYVENSIWVQGPVVFVAIHQPGSNNNKDRVTGLFQDVANNEYTARNAANIAFLNQAFAIANSNSKIRGVVVFSQANPFERYLEVPCTAVNTPANCYASSGYADFITNLRNLTVSSGKQVLYVGGDTHYFRVDKPLTTAYPACNPGANLFCPASGLAASTAGSRISNFTRSEVFAQNDVHWTKISVDKEDPGLFTFEARIVPGN